MPSESSMEYIEYLKINRTRYNVNNFANESVNLYSRN